MLKQLNQFSSTTFISENWQTFKCKWRNLQMLKLKDVCGVGVKCKWRNLQMLKLQDEYGVGVKCKWRNLKMLN